jgi:hypothetical protein
LRQLGMQRVALQEAFPTVHGRSEVRSLWQQRAGRHWRP